jgi:hypothetical protein
MQQEHINQIRTFSYWAQQELNKSVNFEIQFWNHPFDNAESVSFRIWIKDTINKESESLEELVNELPRLREFCALKKELSL